MALNPMETIAKENYDNWSINSSEYQIEADRGTVRLRRYMKDFDEDVIVKLNGAPLIMKASGKALKARDVYPERADLALAADGSLLSQGDFHARYMEWLGAHVMQGDPQYENVPNVADYVSVCHDRFSESPGMIEHYFDPKRDAKFDPSEDYDTEGRKRGEEGFSGDSNEASNDMASKLMQMMMDKLSADQVAEILKKEIDVPVIEIGDSEEVEVKMWTAPCDEVMTAKKKGSHRRWCKEEACVDAREARHSDYSEDDNEPEAA